MTCPKLPGDDRGFIRTDLATRQVAGQPDIYAVGSYPERCSGNTTHTEFDVPETGDVVVPVMLGG